MLKIIITGALGFAGRHLCRLADPKCDWLVGTGLLPEAPDDLPLNEYHRLDVLDRQSMWRLFEAFRPNIIFHLAAQSSVAKAWVDAEATFSVNTLGTLNVLEAAAALDPSPRIVVTCSSEEYGIVDPGQMPLTEDQPLRPNNPYAMSKVFQDYCGQWYYEAKGLPVIRVRSFNHTGPGQQGGFVCADFAARIAAIENGQAPPVIEVGNLQSERDFTDVRDVVRAYWLLALNGEAGQVYNVCSGTAYKVEDLLHRLLGLSKVKIEVVRDPDRDRPSDIPVLLGDYSKLKAQTGWRPKIPIDKTLADLLDSWRTAIGT